MTWRIELTRTATKNLGKIDKEQARKIIKFLKELSVLNDPRQRRKALKGYLGEFWRYRVGNYRVICDIVDVERKILVLRIGFRKDVYR